MTTEIEGERLNRYLARCGLGSRRNVETLIFSGRVCVDGQRAHSPGERVVEGSRVTFDGRPLFPLDSLYLALNKPRGVVCAVSDPFDRTVVDLLPEVFAGRRPFPVGRLDRESEGLLLMTNDGDFAHRILHPRFGVVKRYEVRLDRALPDLLLSRWRRGLRLDGRLVVPHAVERLPEEDRGLSLSLNEGLKREIRRMAEQLGFRVLSLRRCAIGGLVLEHLRLGDFLEVDGSNLWQMIKSGGIV
ncbi:pseudouridine synthase [Aminirod propionatiphilus]|uniref:rRNA pseudouridine synthase n=1 Tax=Aminirod propionatiphilus TaxID=3415223 RepID=A0ACD1DYL9_9BACT|nr:rRNA pseudouridine synthase [Synergistota bacterium]